MAYQVVYAHPSLAVHTAQGIFPGHSDFCVWGQLFYSENTKNQRISPSALPRHSSLTDWIPMDFCMHRFERKVWNSVWIGTSAFMRTWFLSVSRVAFCWNSWVLKGLLLDMLLKVMLPVLERLPNPCFSQNLKGRSGKAQVNGCSKFILLWHWAAFSIFLIYWRKAFILYKHCIK